MFPVLLADDFAESVLVYPDSHTGAQDLLDVLGTGEGVAAEGNQQVRSDIVCVGCK
jgi:hypothetical protein